MKKKLLSLSVLALAAVCIAVGIYAYNQIPPKLPEQVDGVRITLEWYNEDYEELSEKFGEESRQTADMEIVKQLWDLYASLKPTPQNRPMDHPRYWIEFLSEGEVVSDWRISTDGVIGGDLFGPGNHYLKENTAFPVVDELWGWDKWIELPKE